MSMPSQPSAQRPHAQGLAALLAGIVELAGGVLLYVATESWAALFVWHALVVGVYAAIVARRARRGGDCADALLSLAALTAVGPLGAIAAALSALHGTRGEAPELLAAWYRRIAQSIEVDPISRLADKVAIGRTMDLQAPPPASFARVMETGSLGERQAILGLIARAFHPDYLGVLRLALRSPEPVIRVQAAAVAARLLPTLEAHVAGLVANAAEGADAPTPARALAILDEARAVLASGLLDERDQTSGAVAAACIRATTLAALGHAMRDGRTVPAEAAVVRGYEQLLLETARYAEVRQLRRRYRAVGARACAVRRRARQGEARAIAAGAITGIGATTAGAGAPA